MAIEDIKAKLLKTTLEDEDNEKAKQNVAKMQSAQQTAPAQSTQQSSSQNADILKYLPKPQGSNLDPNMGGQTGSTYQSPDRFYDAQQVQTDQQNLAAKNMMYQNAMSNLAATDQSINKAKEQMDNAAALYMMNPTAENKASYDKHWQTYQNLYNLYNTDYSVASAFADQYNTAAKKAVQDQQDVQAWRSTVRQDQSSIQQDLDYVGSEISRYARESRIGAYELEQFNRIYAAQGRDAAEQYLRGLNLLSKDDQGARAYMAQQQNDMNINKILDLASERDRLQEEYAYSSLMYPHYVDTKNLTAEYENGLTDTRFDGSLESARTNAGVNDDPGAIDRDLERINNRIKELTKKKSETEAALNAMTKARGSELYGPQDFDTPTSQKNVYTAQLRDLYEQRDRLRQERAASEYMAVANMPDFAEKSQYKPEKTGEATYVSATFGGVSGELLAPAQYMSSGYKNDIYEYINGNAEVQAQREASGFSWTAWDWLGNMTDEERATYNYLYNSGSQKKADEYLDLITPTLTARQAEKDREYYRKWAMDDKFGASLASVMMSPIQGLSFVGQVVDMLGDGEIDQNAAYNNYSKIGGYIRGAIAEEIESKNGKAAAWIYQQSMSMLDNAFRRALTGGIAGGMGLEGEALKSAMEAMSYVIMGTGSAANTVIEAKNRGLDDWQALSLGVISGSLEAATETWSIESLLDWKGITIGKYLLNTGLAEGSEEIASGLGNWIADVLIAQDKSEWRQQIAEYKADGLTEHEAFWKAFGQKAAEIGLEGLGGAMSGLFSAGGSSIFTALSSKAVANTLSSKLGQGIRTGEFWDDNGPGITMDVFLDNVLNVFNAQEKDSVVYQFGQRLQEKLNNQQNITDNELGQTMMLYSGLVDEAEANGIQVAQLSEAEQNLVDSIPADNAILVTGRENGMSDRSIARLYRISQALDIDNIEVYSSDNKNENGYFNNATGKIMVNARGQNPVAVVIAHELSHKLEGTQAYNDLKKSIVDNMGQEAFDAAVDEIMSRYAKGGKQYAHSDRAAAEADVIAEVVQNNLFNNEQAIRSIVKNNTTFTEQMRSLLDKAVMKLGKKTSDSYVEAADRTFLRNARALYGKAFYQMKQGQTGNAVWQSTGEETVKQTAPKTAQAQTARQAAQTNAQAEQQTAQANAQTNAPNAERVTANASNTQEQTQKMPAQGGQTVAAPDYTGEQEYQQASKYDDAREELSRQYDNGEITLEEYQDAWDAIAQQEEEDAADVQYSVNKDREGDEYDRHNRGSVYQGYAGGPDSGSDDGSDRADSGQGQGPRNFGKSTRHGNHDEKAKTIPYTKRDVGRGRQKALYTTDSEGYRLTQDEAETLKDSAIRDENGQIIPTYHFTSYTFDRFERGDIGFHFGTLEQAKTRQQNNGSTPGRIVRAYQNITNPLYVDQDVGAWYPPFVALQLADNDIITSEQLAYIKQLSENGDIGFSSKAARQLREILNEMGYDGIRYPNGSEGEGDSYIAFSDDQIVGREWTDVDENGNVKESSESDKQYSYSSERDNEYLTAVNSGDMDTAREMVEEAATDAGYTIRAYHGTGRADRVGTVFRPDRATSGPMAFFTDDRTIAESYSKNKRDTSISYDSDYDTYETQFRFKTRPGAKFPIDRELHRAWGYVPMEKRAEIRRKAGQLRFDWDGDDDQFILDEQNKESNGGFQWQLKEANGNVLRALEEQWLNSGNLFNEESRFLDVLDMVGVTDALKSVGLDVEYKDPDYREEKVYDVFLRIQTPFDATKQANEDFIQQFEDWYAEQDADKYERDSMGADFWDKNSVSAEDFAERLRDDLESGYSHAWTSIPDSMTDYLKSLGYDGIKDTGGKFTGQQHTVWVPFSSEQVKSADTVTYDDKGEIIPPSERFNSEKDDIRWSYGWTKDGRPYVNVDEDILAGVDPADWAKVVQQNLAQKFPNGFDVGNTHFTINRKTKTEHTDSKYANRLRLNSPDLYQDKLRVTNNLDEAARAAYEWTEEAPKHSSKNKFVSAARANLLMQIGDRQYEAQMVAGTKQNGDTLPYDILNIRPASFETKENTRSEMASTDKGANTSRSTDVSADNVAQTEPVVNPQDEDYSNYQYSYTDEITDPTDYDDTRQQWEIEGESDFRDTMTRKGRDQLAKAERNALHRIGKALSVPKHVQKDYLDRYVREMANDYFNDGHINQRTVDDLFERAYDEGVVQDREFYDAYKDVKDYIRNTPISFSDTSDIADYAAFRKQAFGLMDIRKFDPDNKDILPVDVMYEELHQMAPELFPAADQNGPLTPADQLQHIYDVADSIRIVERNLDEAYGDDPFFKQMSKMDFDSAVQDLVSELRNIKRFEDFKKDGQTIKSEITVDAVKKAYKDIKAARQNLQRIQSRQLMTDRDHQQVGRLLRGEITLGDLNPDTDNVNAIKAVYEAKAPVEELNRVIREYKQQIRNERMQTAYGLLGNINEWKDKKAGIQYARETFVRNVRDIAPNDETAEGIIKQYYDPIQKNQAIANREKAAYRNRVEALDLSRKVAKGNTVSESYAVQLLGEATDNIRMIEQSRGAIQMRDGHTAQEWQEIINNLYADNPNMDWDKINNAIQEFRSIYDELLEQMNEARVRNGYEPVSYRQGYFPHFASEEDNILKRFGQALGINTAVSQLPTAINGLTHTFKPGITWFGNAQQRLGYETTYDAVQGFDRYIEGVMDVIHHTDDIQNLRALERAIRYLSTDEGIQQQVDAVLMNPNLDEITKSQKIDKIYEDAKFALGNFVNDLNEYTNIIANKKSRLDRGVESVAGRRIYTTVKNIENRIAANMISINPASWLTNFIPLTQAWSAVSTRDMLTGMWETLRAMAGKDTAFVDASDFLTNRRGSDPLVRSAMERASQFAGAGMEIIDNFTSEAIVRARYNQNLRHGMSEEEAMLDANRYTAGLMAGRSKGEMPTLFHSKNPLVKLFTQFQLEVNNQLSYLFKDLPREKKDKGLAALFAGILRFALGAWLYNEIYEAFIGRRAALDPVDMLNSAVGDVTGYHIPSLRGLITGDEVDFRTEKAKNVADYVTNRIGDVTEEMPFTSVIGLFDSNFQNGRIPISSAIPNMSNVVKGVSEVTSGNARYGWEKLGKEGRKLLYVAPPFGGGAVKKALEGLTAYFKGGSYTVDSEGRDVLQYPVYEGVGTFLQSAIFGKTATSGGQEWIANDFKNMSAKNTAVWQAITELDTDDPRNVYDFIKGYSEVEKTDDETKAQRQRDYINNYDISGEAKAILYASTLSEDSNEYNLIGQLEDMGADMAEVTRVLMGFKDAAKQYEGQGYMASNAKRDILLNATLSEPVRMAIYQTMVSSSKNDVIDSFLNAGLDFDDFCKVQNKYSEINDTVKGASNKAIEFSRWVNAQNYNAQQEDAVRDGFNFYSQIPASAAKYDKLIDAGLNDSEAYKLVKTIDDLQPFAGKSTVSDLQKANAVVNAGLSEKKTEEALSVYLSDSEMHTIDTAKQFGFSAKDYVKHKYNLRQYDADENGSYKQSEITAYIDSLNMSNDDKAALWQLLTGSTSAKNNPYDKTIGQQVIDAR